MKSNVCIANLFVCLERDVPDDHVVQEDPQTPDGGLIAVVFVALDPLGWSVDTGS